MWSPPSPAHAATSPSSTLPRSSPTCPACPPPTPGSPSSGRTATAPTPYSWRCSSATKSARLAQAGVADVGPLALGVAGAVTAAAVGDAGLPGHRVRLFQAAPDDHGAVGQHQRRARPGLCLALGAGGGALLGRAHAGDDCG